MKIWHRRVMWISTFVLFLVITPLILLYSLGSTFNWQNKTWQQTGILFIKTYPRAADIFLDGQLVSAKTPFQVAKLKPGNYHLKISKENYFDWEKNLAINAGQTTFVEDVVLFTKPSSEVLNTINQSQIISNFSNEQAIILDHKEKDYNFIFFDNKFSFLKNILHIQSELPIKLISLSNNGRKLIYQKAEIFYILNIESPSIHYPIKNLSKSDFQNFSWDDTDDDIIYSKVGNHITKYEITAMNTIKLNVLENISHFFVFNKEVYFTRPSNDGFNLILYRTADLRKFQELALIPMTSDLKLVFNTKTLTIHDVKNGFLYYFDENQDTLLKHVFPNVKQASWYYQSNDKIMYISGHEINIYFVNRDERKLITRQSQTITRAWWHPNGAYIFYQINDDLYLTELDERDNHNTYKLGIIQKNSPLFISDKGDAIFYYSTSNNQFVKQLIQ